MEAEVGPIKYIAHLLYGENPDANILEKAVIWVTVLIVIVLDPLAVILLLASQFSFQRFRQMETEEAEPTVIVPETTVVDTPEAVAEMNEGLPPLEEDTPVVWAGIDHTRLSSDSDEDEEVTEPEKEIVWVDKFPEPVDLHFPEVKVTLPVVEELVVVEEQPIDDDTQIIDNASLTEKEAMTRWKQENPDDTVKHQRRLLEIGKINRLPWQDYQDADEAAAEAAKWASENPQTEEAQVAEEWAAEQIPDVERPGDYVVEPDADSKKKDNDLDGEAREGSGQKKQRGLEGYVQNAEQSSITLWQRVKKAKDNE